MARTLPFFRKFQITCPPQAVKLMTPRSGKNPEKVPAEKARWTDETLVMIIGGDWNAGTGEEGGSTNEDINDAKTKVRPKSKNTN